MAGQRASRSVVYHYCSLETFFAILSSKAMRLCEIDKSNDSTEITFIRDILRYGFLEQYGYARSRGDKHLPPPLLYEGWLDEALEHYFGPRRPYSCLAACFSAKGDLLSQWRGYANDGGGVSIGFSKNALEYLMSHKKQAMDEAVTMFPYSEAPPYGDICYLRRSDYRPKGRTATQTVWIKEFAKEALEEMRRLRLPFGTPQPDEAGPERARDILQHIIGRAFQQSALYKNAGFAEEGEWRMLTVMPRPGQAFPFENLAGDEETRVAAMAKGNKLIYYTALPIAGHPKIIKRVVIGPKCEASVDDVAACLAMNGFAVPTKNIEKSVVSYR